MKISILPALVQSSKAFLFGLLPSDAEFPPPKPTKDRNRILRRCSVDRLHKVDIPCWQSERGLQPVDVAVFLRHILNIIAGSQFLSRGFLNQFVGQKFRAVTVHVFTQPV